MFSKQRQFVCSRHVACLQNLWSVFVNVNVKSVGGGGPLPQKHVVCVVLAVYIVHYRHCSPGDRSLRKCNDFVSVRIRGKETNSDQNQSSGPPEPQPNRAPLKSSGFRCLYA